MPLRTLQISTLEDSGVARFTELEPSIDIGVYGNYVVNLIRSTAYAVHPITWLINDVVKDALPQLAKGDVLDNNFGVMETLPRKPASRSVGDILVYGDSGDVVPLFTEFTTNSGIKIRTTTAGVVSKVQVSILSSVNVNGVVTFNAVNEFPKGSKVNIVTNNILVDGLREVIGSDGVSFSIKIDDTSQFSVSGVAFSYYAKIPAESLEQGIDQNIVGSVDLLGYKTAYTSIYGMSGASDPETDERYASRIIKVRGALEGVFTASQVILASLSVAGNTRAWVVTPLYNVSGGVEGEAGYKPKAGQVCVYVMRDDDDDPIPDAIELNLTKQAIIYKGKMPVHTLESDIFVFAPKLVQAKIQIMNLSPNTPEMRRAIEVDLKAYFEDQVDFEQSVTIQQLSVAIVSVRDSANQRVLAFDLISGGFDAGSGELIVYGGVEWL